MSPDHPAKKRKRRRLFPPKAAAKYLAISERKLFDLTKQKLIPCVRIGRSVRYDVADLKSFINRQKGEAS